MKTAWWIGGLATLSAIVGVGYHLTRSAPGTGPTRPVAVAKTGDRKSVV